MIHMKNDKNQDVNRNSNVAWNDGNSDVNQYETLHDKWNVIKEEYMAKFPQLDTQDLVFESGGFEGLLAKISEIREKSIDDIRLEIEKW